MSIQFKSDLSSENIIGLYHSIDDGSTGKAGYYIMVVLAAVVASLGLLVNSTAVIIGAMLISPIMGPILGISFSITTGNGTLMGKAFGSVAMGVVTALCTSIFITMVFPNASITSEILARTTPTLADLVIAIASGAAGAYTMCKASGFTTLAGVAIATALMPPLCVVGIGIASFDASIAEGGALLFLSNLIGINLAAATVFLMLGISTIDGIGEASKFDKKTEAKKRRNRFILSILATVVISLPLALIMYVSVMESQTGSAIEASLKNSLSSYNYAELVSYEYKMTNDTFLIHTVVRAEESFGGNDIIRMQNKIERDTGKPAVIIMELVHVSNVNQNTVSNP